MVVEVGVNFHPLLGVGRRASDPARVPHSAGRNGPKFLRFRADEWIRFRTDLSLNRPEVGVQTRVLTTDRLRDDTMMRTADAALNCVGVSAC